MDLLLLFNDFKRNLNFFIYDKTSSSRNPIQAVNVITLRRNHKIWKIKTFKIYLKQ